MPPDAAPGVHGLKGEYFTNTDCAGDPVFVRIDTVINFSLAEYHILPCLLIIIPSGGPEAFWLLIPEHILSVLILMMLSGYILMGRRSLTGQTTGTGHLMLLILIEKGNLYDLKIEYTEQWYNAQGETLGGTSE